MVKIVNNMPVDVTVIIKADSTNKQLIFKLLRHDTVEIYLPPYNTLKFNVVNSTFDGLERIFKHNEVRKFITIDFMNTYNVVSPTSNQVSVDGVLPKITIHNNFSTLLFINDIPISAHNSFQYHGKYGKGILFGYELRAKVTKMKDVVTKLIVSNQMTDIVFGSINTHNDIEHKKMYLTNLGRSMTDN